MEEAVDRALTEAEAARFLGVSQATLKKLRSTGGTPGGMPSPPYFKFSARAVRYSLADLEEYREARRVQ